MRFLQLLAVIFFTACLSPLNSANAAAQPLPGPLTVATASSANQLGANQLSPAATAPFAADPGVIYLSFAGDDAAPEDSDANADPYVHTSDRIIFSTLDKVLNFMLHLSKFQPVFFVAIAGFVLWRILRGVARTARGNYDYIITHRSDIANRLRDIDIRAHSLSSVLADSTLQNQWSDIREEFLATSKTMDSVKELSHSSSTLQLSRNFALLRDTRAAVASVVNAEANFEELARMEQGDTSVRRTQLTDLQEDVLLALADAKPAVAGKLEVINSRIQQLRNDLSNPYFMTSYADILGDYNVLVQEVERQKFKRRNPKKTPTTVGSANWHPGMGSYYIPFEIVNSWYDVKDDGKWHISHDKF